MGCVQGTSNVKTQSGADAQHTDAPLPKAEAKKPAEQHQHQHTHFNDAGEEKPHRKMSSQMGIFSGMALKFPLVRKAFRNVKSAFRKHCDDTENISVVKLGDLLHSLGAKNLSDAEIQALFKTADLDKSKSISFREFLIAIAIGYYLKEDVPASQRGPDFEETQKGFKVIQTFFKKIDKDNGGSVDTVELKAALFESATDQSNDILEARFKELDFNGDGNIEFPEFFFGFTKWVMGEDEDEEEDDEQERIMEENTRRNEEAKS